MDLNYEFLLHSLFDEVNATYFDSFLLFPVLHWNSRLQTSAGRFTPGSRKFWDDFPAKIEIASYLRKEPNAIELIQDTLAHEMIHYWLWVHHRPYGHTSEFKAKMKAMGVNRYNTVPRVRPYRYVYRCINCQKSFFTRRRLRGVLACAKCCKEHTGGRYDSRFKLFLERQLEIGEVVRDGQICSE